MAELVKENAKPSNQKRCHVINRSLIPAKAVQFFKGGGEAVFHKFVPLYMRSVGLSPSETGIISSAQPFVTFLVSPMFGAFVDKYHKHKSTVVITGLLSVLIYLCLVFVPAKDQPQINWCYNNSQIYSVRSSRNEMISSYNRYSPVDEHRNLSSKWETRLLPSLDHDDVCNILCKIINRSVLETFDLSCVLASISKLPPTNNDKIVCNSVNETRIREHLGKYTRLNSEDNINCTGVSDGDCPVFVCRDNYKIQTSYKEFEQTFVLNFIVYTLGSAIYAPIMSLLYAMMYAVLGNNWGDWGRQRLWGSVAGIISVIGTTVLLDTYSHNQENAPYSFCFYVFSVEITLCCVFAAMFKLPADIKVGSVWRGSLKLFRGFQNIAFFINVTVFGMYLGANVGFTFWYILEQNTSESAKENEHLILGLLTALDLLCEIPVYYIGGDILKRLGHIPVMGMTSMMYGLRFISYTFIRNPWFVLLTAPLNPLSFAIFEFTSTSYANMISPPGLAAVSQSVVAGLHLGLGCGSGALLTGFLFEQIGGTWTFRLYACSCFFIMAPFIFLQWCIYGKQHITPSADNVTDLNHDDIEICDSVVESTNL